MKNIKDVDWQFCHWHRDDGRLKSKWVRIMSKLGDRFTSVYKPVRCALVATKIVMPKYFAHYFVQHTTLLGNCCVLMYGLFVLHSLLRTNWLLSVIYLKQLLHGVNNVVLCFDSKPFLKRGHINRASLRLWRSLADLADNRVLRCNFICLLQK